MSKLLPYSDVQNLVTDVFPRSRRGRPGCVAPLFQVPPQQEGYLLEPRGSRLSDGRQSRSRAFYAYDA